MSFTMNLATLCDDGGDNGTNGCHLAVFSVDSLCIPLVAIHPPPNLPPYRSASDNGYTSKYLSKMQEICQLAIHSIVSE